MVTRRSDRLAAEAEARAGAGPIRVPLAAAQIDIPPPWSWSGAAIAALAVGDYELWAAECLDDESRKAWLRGNPRIKHCRATFAAWGSRSGQDVSEIVRLSAALAEHERQIEYDLRVHCHVDLRDLWRPGGGASKLTYRLLGVLLDGLPGHSAYKTAVRDSIPVEELTEMGKQPRDKHGSWSHTDLLVAALIDRVELLRRDLVAVNGGKIRREFEPFPRPGVPAGRTRRALSPEGLAHLHRLREEHARIHGYEVGA